MTVVVLPFPAQRVLAADIAVLLEAHGFESRVGRLDWRRFPDGESLVAVDEVIDGADVILLASLRDPDAMALALRYAAATAREFGARSVGLVAPYLAYMRQDARFHPGEAITAPLFAGFLEDSFDWLATVDPHLHRIPTLDAVFRIPTRCVAAAPAVAGWIRDTVTDPVLIGPDGESEQWVADIAGRAGLPYQVLSKQRSGDRDVQVSLPDPGLLRGRTPVIVDDIISTGQTIVEALRHLSQSGSRPAICVTIHAVFAEGAYETLLAAGAARVVSTDTISHASNAIPLAPLLAEAAAELLRAGPTTRASGGLRSGIDA